MPQHDVERAPVASDQAVEALLHDVEEAPMLARFRVQEARAQHRGERERNQRRDRDRGGDRQGEFAEQAPDDAAHEQERNEHRDQRAADREHREADLPRSLDRRLERRHAVLDVAVDVLHHHDGVVDHEADRDGERHQGQVVEAEIEQIHRGARAQQRQRHRDGGDERRPEIAQEQQNDHHHEGDRDPEREFDVMHGGPDGLGAVENGLDLHGGRELGHEAAAAGP